MADTTPRFRDLACAAGGTGLLLAGVALLLAGHRTTPPHGQQALVEMWQRAVDDFALGPAASLLPVIVGVTVVVAAAVVIALSIRPGGAPPVLRLRRALLLGSAGVVWFFLASASRPLIAAFLSPLPASPSFPSQYQR